MKICPACGLVFPDESTFCFLSGDTLEATADPLIGTTIDGRFRIESALGETPWARLYGARFRLLQEHCTVKVLKEPLTDDQRPRFLEAVTMARRCTHDNVVELAAGGITNDNVAYKVHRQRKSEPLTAALAKGPLAPSQALSVTAQVLKGLARIHDFGGVHGNLRPTNILWSTAGHADVVDVGLGRSLLRPPWEDDPQSFLAQQYLAPELTPQEAATIGADLYAVGVITFQLLSGGLPIEADDVGELRAAFGEEPAESLGARLGKVAAPIVTWLERMLTRMAPDRPSNAHVALGELRTACKEAGQAIDDDPGGAAAAGEADLDGCFARWSRFSEVFTKMADTGFPGGAPDQTRNTLQMIQGRAEQLSEIAKKAKFEHGGMNDISVRATEGRKNISDQMDALNGEAGEIHEQLSPLTIAAARHGENAEPFPARAREQHREVLRWEGRSGFREPYQELVTAYNEMAEIIDKWWGVRSAQLTCHQQAEALEQKVSKLEVQVDELRSALGVHESNLTAEIEASEKALHDLGVEADRLEFELLDLASRYSAPLRAKPELGGCFRELEQVT
ncbi:MAG: protein kinase [Deltaproteobacteria bacterium]|nr:protein kinase [Deltaproteobacteria bacterium]